MRPDGLGLPCREPGLWTKKFLLNLYIGSKIPIISIEAKFL